MDYCIYWWKEPEMTNPWFEGYIGITKELERRNYSHRKDSNWYDDDLEQVILKEGLTKDQAEGWEKQFRPKPRIGWNVVAGGGMPPKRTREEGNLGGVTSKKPKEERMKMIQLVLDGMPYRQIGKIYRCQRQDIKKWAKEYGIELPKKPLGRAKWH